jgi:hypothetical protein
MTCNPKHVTYQTERRQKSPQLPLPPGPPAKVVEPAKTAELDHFHIGASEPYSIGFDAGNGRDYSAIVVVDANGRLVAHGTWS